jgi:hypothetical protein
MDRHTAGLTATKQVLIRYPFNRTTAVTNRINLILEEFYLVAYNAVLSVICQEIELLITTAVKTS